MNRIGYIISIVSNKFESFEILISNGINVFFSTFKQVSNQVCISFDFRSLTVAKKTGEGFEVAEYEVIDEESLWPDWVVAKVQFGLSLDTDAKGKSLPYKEVLQTALEDLQTAILSTNPPVFNVEDTEINLYKGKTVNGVANESTVGDVLLELESENDTKPRDHRSFDVLHLDTFLNLTCESKDGEGKTIDY